MNRQLLFISIFLNISPAPALGKLRGAVQDQEQVCEAGDCQPELQRGVERRYAPPTFSIYA